VAPGKLVEPEFVAHVFAPLDGPEAPAALESVHGLWANFHDQLGMSRPILGADVGMVLPADLADGPDGPIAALEDAAAQFQAIARREHDLVNVSFAVAAPGAIPRSRPLLSASTPPGWPEFTRWWQALGGAEGLLGGAVVYLAKTDDAASVDLRAEVPPRPDDADHWWAAGFSLNGFAAWEATAAGWHASRRLVLLAELDEDAELSGFAWSDGGTGLPPLGRYLMHAAKLRYAARVRGDGGRLTRLQDRATGRLDAITAALADPGGPAPAADQRAGLGADEAELARTLSRLRRMRLSVDIARSNMAKAIPALLPADAELAAWLPQQLADDAEYLAATHQEVGRLRSIVGTARSGQPAPARPRSPDAVPDSAEPKIEYRVGFGIDVVSYSSRTTPQQSELQRRVAGMVERVIADLDISLDQTDRQLSGDGLMAVLPARVPAHVALRELLHGWRVQAAADSARHPEQRIRLRLSVGNGPFTPGELGFAGDTIIEIGRLLDSQELRGALTEHPDADVVALVADRLYRDVVVPGYPGLTAGEFARIDVRVKSYSGPAWLWTGGGTRRQPGPKPAPASGGRDVFVIHGRDDKVRSAFFGLLRSLGLRPLGWDEIVTRTGKPSPLRDEVVAAGFAAGPGAVVLITPGDVTGNGSDVLFRAGRAMEVQPDRTLLVEIGDVPRIRDLDGRETVRLDADTPGDRTVFQYKVAQRLRLVGYRVDEAGTDWLDPERFSGLT